MSSKFDGQRLEIGSDHDGNRKRLTVGSPEFKTYYDELMLEIVETDTRLEALKDTARDIYGQLDRPLNGTTGVAVKSGTIKGNELSGKFVIKPEYALTETSDKERSDQEMFLEIHEKYVGAFTSLRVYPKDAMRNMLALENFSELNINIKETEKVSPSWKPTIFKKKTETTTESEQSEPDVKSK